MLASRRIIGHCRLSCECMHLTGRGRAGGYRNLSSSSSGQQKYRTLVDSSGKLTYRVLTDRGGRCYISATAHFVVMAASPESANVPNLVQHHSVWDERGAARQSCCSTLYMLRSCIEGLSHMQDADLAQRLVLRQACHAGRQPA